MSDDDGSPLPGVAVLVVGTSTGTTTSGDGRFSLGVPENSVLTFSFLGLRTVEVAASPQMTVRMEPDTHMIDEIVTVAYGSQRKISVTGSIASIGTEELSRSSATNVASALAGRLPGLTIMQNSGHQPGKDAVTMYLRGQSTLNDSSPLILIDGVPRTNLSVLDPNEIETVTVLKDASATAVFGVRGANGVLLITTRRGTEGKLELSVNFDYSMSSFTTRPTRVHSWEHAELRNQAARNDGYSEDNLPYTDYMIGMYKSGENPVFYPDRDTYREFFHKWAPTYKLNVNMSGGNQKVRYFLNAGYINQHGIMKVDKHTGRDYDARFRMDRFTFRSNLDFNIAKSLTAALNIGSYLQRVNQPSLSGGGDTIEKGATEYAMTVAPTLPGPLTAEGYGAPAGEVLAYYNALYGYTHRAGYRRVTTVNLNSSFSLDWKLGFITEGLSTRGMIAFDNVNINYLDNQLPFDEYGAYVARSADEQSYYYIMTDRDPVFHTNKYYDTNYYINLQYTINYARSFGLHDVTGLLLAQRDNWQSYGAEVPYNMVGFAARATYSYDYRYLAEINMGYNGSEQFNPNRRFGFFPAASIGWIISNESFLKDNRVLTNLKFRASLGKVGNDKLHAARFLYIDQINMYGGGTLPSLGSGQYIYQGKIANSDVTWETAVKQNYGIDLQLWGSLSFSADVFREKREDILISLTTIPDFSGIEAGNLPAVNWGRVDNRGYELELTYLKKFTGDLAVQFRGNYSYNKNTVKYANEVTYPEDYAVRKRIEGFSLGQQFGYIRDFSNGGNGYINTQEELDALPDYSAIGKPRIGDFKYVDVNGDGRLTAADMVPIGYTRVPRINYGASFVVDFKGFDVSVLFQGIAKTSERYLGSGVEEYRGHDGSYNDMHLNAWTEERYMNGEKITYPALSMITNLNHTSNDFFVMNRSFLRLKNIEVGYSLPQSVLKKISIRNCRVYVRGDNVATWHNLRMKSFDPELNHWGETQYPISKMWTCGINITF
ncbi:MAG: TonB-dependent receptor [Alistipes sp.]|nr:TonB-dependent receptor [Alistipes sp.]